jgi:hypothetical protein
MIDTTELERRVASLLEENKALREALEGKPAPFKVGDLLFYDMDGQDIRCTYRGDCEGWPLVTADADGLGAVEIRVRPSRVRARAALSRTKGEQG